MPLPQRKLHRLQSWDYTQPGYYHITICTHQKKKLLAHIHQTGLDVSVIPTQIGQIVLSCWRRTEEVYPGVSVDYHCLMPNHLHGIIVIEKEGISLSEIIRSFKSVTTREYNKLVPASEKNTLWQGSYYDEIIRNDEMLYDVRKYIQGNPSKWLEDSLFTE